MKIHTRLGVIGAVAVSLTPAMVQAETERAALEACVQAMTAEIGEQQGSPVAFRIDAVSDARNRKIFYSTVFHLDATDVATGKVVARVDCRVSPDAVVKRLTTLPLNARNANIRKRG